MLSPVPGVRIYTTTGVESAISIGSDQVDLKCPEAIDAPMFGKSSWVIFS